MKADPQRYPWVKDRTGKTLNILSTFGDATRDADARAYGALMRHIRQVDGKEHTVLMMQVENEVGVLGDSRDHIAAANEAFAKPVPEDLMNYLVQHKATLAPELREVWAANGYKTSGTWEEVFGPGRPDSIPPVPGRGTRCRLAQVILAGGRNLHGLALLDVRQQGGRRRQGRIRHPDVLQHLAAGAEPSAAG